MQSKRSRIVCRNCNVIVFGRDAYLSHIKLCISMNAFQDKITIKSYRYLSCYLRPRVLKKTKRERKQLNETPTKKFKSDDKRSPPRKVTSESGCLRCRLEAERTKTSKVNCAGIPACDAMATQPTRVSCASFAAPPMNPPAVPTSETPVNPSSDRNILGNLSTNAKVGVRSGRPPSKDAEVAFHADVRALDAERKRRPKGVGKMTKPPKRKKRKRQVKYTCKPCRETLVSWQAIRKHLLSSEHLRCASKERRRQIANQMGRKRSTATSSHPFYKTTHNAPHDHPRGPLKNSRPKDVLPTRALCSSSKKRPVVAEDLVRTENGPATESEASRPSLSSSSSWIVSREDGGRTTSEEVDCEGEISDEDGEVCSSISPAVDESSRQVGKASRCERSTSNTAPLDGATVTSQCTVATSTSRMKGVSGSLGMVDAEPVDDARERYADVSRGEETEDRSGTVPNSLEVIVRPVERPERSSFAARQTRCWTKNRRSLFEESVHDLVSSVSPTSGTEQRDHSSLFRLHQTRYSTKNPRSVVEESTRKLVTSISPTYVAEQGSHNSVFQPHHTRYSTKNGSSVGKESMHQLVGSVSPISVVEKGDRNSTFRPHQTRYSTKNAGLLTEESMHDLGSSVSTTSVAEQGSHNSVFRPHQTRYSTKNAGLLTEESMHQLVGSISPTSVAEQGSHNSVFRPHQTRYSTKNAGLLTEESMHDLGSSVSTTSVAEQGSHNSVFRPHQTRYSTKNAGLLTEESMHDLGRSVSTTSVAEQGSHNSVFRPHQTRYSTKNAGLLTEESMHDLGSSVSPNSGTEQGDHSSLFRPHQTRYSTKHAGSVGEESMHQHVGSASPTPVVEKGDRNSTFRTSSESWYSTKNASSVMEESMHDLASSVNPTSVAEQDDHRSFFRPHQTRYSTKNEGSLTEESMHDLASSVIPTFVAERDNHRSFSRPRQTRCILCRASSVMEESMLELGGYITPTSVAEQGNHTSSFRLHQTRHSTKYASSAVEESTRRLASPVGPASGTEPSFPADSHDADSYSGKETDGSESSYPESPGSDETRREPRRSATETVSGSKNTPSSIVRMDYVKSSRSRVSSKEETRYRVGSKVDGTKRMIYLSYVDLGHRCDSLTFLHEFMESRVLYNKRKDVSLSCRSLYRLLAHRERNMEVSKVKEGRTRGGGAGSTLRTMIRYDYAKKNALCRVSRLLSEGKELSLRLEGRSGGGCVPDGRTCHPEGGCRMKCTGRPLDAERSADLIMSLLTKDGSCCCECHTSINKQTLVKCLRRENE